jgi:hypothetical protein
MYFERTASGIDPVYQGHALPDRGVEQLQLGDGGREVLRQLAAVPGDVDAQRLGAHDWVVGDGVLREVPQAVEGDAGALDRAAQLVQQLFRAVKETPSYRDLGAPLAPRRTAATPSSPPTAVSKPPRIERC